MSKEDNCINGYSPQNTLGKHGYFVMHGQMEVVPRSFVMKAGCLGMKTPGRWGVASGYSPLGERTIE